MLTKLQLNDLQQSLKLIVDAARKTRSSPGDFFNEIASASAYMSRDPAALSKGASLARAGCWANTWTACRTAASRWP